VVIEFLDDSLHSRCSAVISPPSLRSINDDVVSPRTHALSYLQQGRPCVMPALISVHLCCHYIWAFCSPLFQIAIGETRHVGATVHFKPFQASGISPWFHGHVHLHN
jgi:hypothetical protein